MLNSHEVPPRGVFTNRTTSDLLSAARYQVTPTLSGNSGSTAETAVKNSGFSPGAFSAAH